MRIVVDIVVVDMCVADYYISLSQCWQARPWLLYISYYYTPIYYLPPFTIYPYLLFTPIYYLLPFTIYPHLLFTPIYYLPPFTIYPHLLFTPIWGGCNPKKPKKTQSQYYLFQGRSWVFLGFLQIFHLKEINSCRHLAKQLSVQHHCCASSLQHHNRYNRLNITRKQYFIHLCAQIKKLAIQI